MLSVSLREDVMNCLRAELECECDEGGEDWIGERKELESRRPVSEFKDVGLTE